LYNYFDMKTVGLIFDEHITGKSNKRLFIWSMIYLDKFFKMYK